MSLDEKSPLGRALKAARWVEEVRGETDLGSHIERVAQAAESGDIETLKWYVEQLNFPYRDSVRMHLEELGVLGPLPL